jgi:hypothetical protein
LASFLSQMHKYIILFSKIDLNVNITSNVYERHHVSECHKLKFNHAEGEEYSETMHSFECDYTEVGSGGRIAFVTAIHLQAEVSLSACPSLQYLNTLMTALHNIATLLFVFLCLC